MFIKYADRLLYSYINAWMKLWVFVLKIACAYVYFVFYKQCNACNSPVKHGINVPKYRLNALILNEDPM